jgi:uncharacterized membrane protein (DUF485 family)
MSRGYLALVRAIAFGAVWFGVFVALGRYAPGFMDDSLYRSFTVGHALALSQFAMIALVGWAQVRSGEPEWEASSSAPQP